MGRMINNGVVTDFTDQFASPEAMQTQLSLPSTGTFPWTTSTVTELNLMRYADIELHVTGTLTGAYTANRSFTSGSGHKAMKVYDVNNDTWIDTITAPGFYRLAGRGFWTLTGNAGGTVTVSGGS